MAILIYPLVFGSTLFLSAALLFLIQPLLGKVLLHRLGGTPMVWNACLVFFQALLLAGYVYAHLLQKLPGKRWQLLWQAVLFVALLPWFFPFDLGRIQPDFSENLYVSTLWLLLQVAGLPIFLVSSTAPLMQKWFANAGHPSRHDPYFLYAASNVGSLLALLAYPAFIEPAYPISWQNRAWLTGFGLLGGCIVVCALLTWFGPQFFGSTPNVPRNEAAVASGRPTWRHRFRWLTLAAIPAGLLMGLNATLTLDVAPPALLWVVPLALYLFTFILAFARIVPSRIVPPGWLAAIQVVQGMVIIVLVLALLALPESDTLLEQACAACVVILILILPYRWVTVAQPFTVLLALILWLAGTGVLHVLPLSIHLLAFYFTARLCHHDLAQNRPDSHYLTEFYLYLAAGGALGGLCTALLSPLLFQNGFVEYPLALLLGCLARPTWVKNGIVDGLVGLAMEVKDRNSIAAGRRRHSLARLFDVLVAAAGVGVVFAAFSWTRSGHAALDQFGGGGQDVGQGIAHVLSAIGTPLLFCLLVIGRPIRFALPLCALVLLHAFSWDGFGPGNVVHAGRSYFGLLKVEEISQTPAGFGRARAHILLHGNTRHGMNFQEPRRDEPGGDLSRLATTYFHADGPIGTLMRKFDWFPGPANTYWADARMPAGLVGLGALCPGPVASPFAPALGVWSEPPMGVIGLGAGTLASYARPFQHAHFYEIDQAVIDLSLFPPDGECYFNFLKQARQRGVNIQVVRGDGRLALQNQGPDGFYQLLFMDAFSSDSVPVHLLTREAIEMYFRKLAPTGILCINVSNRHVELGPVVSAVAENLGYACVQATDTANEPLTHLPSQWILLARSADHLPPVDSSPPGQIWENLPSQGAASWTDEQSDLAGVIKDHRLMRLFNTVLALLCGFGVLLLAGESGALIWFIRANCDRTATRRVAGAPVPR